MKNLTISILLLSLLSACVSDQPAEVEATPPAQPAEEKAAVAPVAPVAAVAPVATDALNDANSILAKRSAYFDFDKSAIKESDKPVVQAHGQYLAGRADRKVVVEGNADERGSSEYNLALGNRRADSVKKMLVVSGAKADQVSTTSFGEEKPAAKGHNEAAWSQNRRADIVYK